jgi:hypothetical protein
MLRTLFGILLFIWLLGLVAHIGGSLIHALLVVAIALLLFDLLTGRSVGA